MPLMSQWWKNHGQGTLPSPQLLETVCPSQVQPANSILFAKGPGSESRSGLLSYFLLTLGFIGPSLSELNSLSETSAWILLPPVNQNSSHLVDRLIGWYYDNKACVDVIEMAHQLCSDFALSTAQSTLYTLFTSSLGRCH